VDSIQIRRRTLFLVSGGIFLLMAGACLFSLLLGVGLSLAFVQPRLANSQARVAQAEMRAMKLEAELQQMRVQMQRPAAMLRPAPAPMPAPARGGFENIVRPTSSLAPGEIINVNFAGEGKAGPAAIGKGETDYWNRYHFPFAQRATLEDLVTISGRNTGAILQTHTLTGEWGWTGPDPMWSTFCYSETDSGHLRFPNLPPGVYNLYVFGHSAGDPNPEQAWESFSRTRVEASGKDYGVLATEASHEFLTTDWKKGVHYVLFENVEVQPGGMVNITLLRGGNNAKPGINGLQIERVR
jgi:hypothetical protein